MSKIQRIVRRVLFPVRKIEWRLQNRKNATSMQNPFDMGKVIVGRYSYGKLNVSFFGAPNEALSIGDFCSIADGVKFICGGEHRMDTIMTFPFEHRVFGRVEAICKGPIVVEDDVWIGTNAVILSGVTLGRGSVVAAGAVVGKDVPPYAIVGGIPAKIVKYRFSEDTIQELMRVDFSCVDDDFVRSHRNEFLGELSQGTIEILKNHA